MYTHTHAHTHTHTHAIGARLVCDPDGRNTRNSLARLSLRGGMGWWWWWMVQRFIIYMVVYRWPALDIVYMMCVRAACVCAYTGDGL